jgi:hypothetical protein
LNPPRIDKWNSLKGGEKAELVRQCVEYILEKYPTARNSDLYLTILALRYCTSLGKYISVIPFDMIREYDGILEAIRRTRQKLNEQGLYLPTDPDIIERRVKKSKKIKRAVKALD